MPGFDLSQLFIARYNIASITYWNRLDSYPRSREVGRGLKAEVHDAMWMLTRQWQFGEFKGEDAGSPVSAKVGGTHITPTSVTVSKQVLPYDQSIPIEAIAEREAVVPTLRLRVQMGKMFLRLLKTNGLANRTDFFIAHFPLAPPADTEIKTTQFFDAVTGRVPDGFSIYQKAKPNLSAFFNGITDSPLNATESKTITEIVLVQFVKWYDALYYQVSNEQSAWLRERMEYSFQVNVTQGGVAATTLSAAEYPGGRLDWNDFDLQSTPVIATRANPVVAQSEEKADVFLPTIVSYRGMPNPRFWQMEEGTMDYGKIEQSPAGIVGLLLAEYGLTYSNDWFLLPWPVKTNTVCNMQGIVVNDVFGQRNFVAPASVSPDADWDRFGLFTHSNAKQNVPSQQVFYLPAVTGAVQASEPLERIFFMRDEMANLLWAIEDIVPAQTGGGRKILSVLPEPIPANPDPATWQYTLGTTVPEHWIPFVAVHKPGSDTEIRLQRGRMPNAKPPGGVLLTESQPVQFIEPQEVPRSGVIVERGLQRVRWLDGKTYLWVGRRKMTGRGEGSSGLEFDKMS